MGGWAGERSLRLVLCNGDTRCQAAKTLSPRGRKVGRERGEGRERGASMRCQLSTKRDSSCARAERRRNRRARSNAHSVRAREHVENRPAVSRRKRGISYDDDAARILRLTDEEIARRDGITEAVIRAAQPGN